MPLREIRSTMDTPPSDRRLREELLHLKKVGLVSSSGHGRGAAWSLGRHENK
jgi:ATP-dependent DNA helicase RecG